MSLGTTLKIGFDATSVKRGLDGLGGKVAKFSSSIAKMGVVTLAAGLTAAGVAAVAFAKSASSAAAEMESLETQFGVLLKSTDKAKEMIGLFREEAMKSPLSIEDYAKAGKTMLAFGMSSDKVMPALKALGDVSMGNADRFSSLALAFSQTQAAGRLMGQEVLQFVNAGFNPLQEISKKTGKSMVQLKKEMEDGAISAKMVSDAFVSATAKGGLFYGALEKGSQTTEGKIAKLKDSVSQLKVAFGTGFNEGLKDALDATNSFLPKLMESMKTAGKFIGTALSEAVEGDYSKFELIGRIIGEAIKLGIKNSIESTGATMAKGISDMGIGSAEALGVGKLVDSIKGEGSFAAAKASSNSAFADSMQNRQEQNSSSSGLRTALDELNLILKQQKTQEKRSVELSQQRELGKQIAAGMKTPGINGNTQVSIGRAISVLMSIDKKITTTAPARM